MFKGIAPPSQILATAASGTPPRRPTRGPKSGRKCYISPTLSRFPNKGDKIKAGPKEGGYATSPLNSWGPPTPSAGRKSEVATSPLPSQGSPTKGTRSMWAQKRRKCYITPAFSGVPNKGDKIKVGTKEGGDATSPLHSRGCPSKWGQNQNWLPKPCLLEDPQVGGNATSTLLSQGYPTKGTKTKH